jgi:hypothetical protein
MRKKTLFKIGVPLVLTATMGVSLLLGDTLLLKDGRSIEGAYYGGNARTVRFQVNGSIRNYAVSDIDDLQFGASTIGSVFPAQRFVTFQNALFRIDHPSDWQVYRDGDSVTFAPPNGRVGNNLDLAYGAVVNLFQPRSIFYPYGQQFQGLQGPELQGLQAPLQAPDFAMNSLNRSMDQLVDELHRSNPGMREISARQDLYVDGARGFSMRFTNDSPLGGRETDWLVALQHREGVVYFLFTAPEREFSNYERNVFQRMLNSVHITG